jgi:hypothetical protein
MFRKAVGANLERSEEQGVDGVFVLWICGAFPAFDAGALDG